MHMEVQRRLQEQLEVSCVSPPGVLFWSTLGTQDMLNTPTIWTWDNSNLVKLDSFFLVVRCCKVATTSSSSLAGPETSTDADWGSRQVFTIHPGESQGNPSQPYRGGTRTWSSTCKAHRFGIHCDNWARQAFLSLSGCALPVSPWTQCSRSFSATPTFPSIRHLITKELPHEP